MVDNQSHGYRNVFVPEEPDALRHAVFIDFKILLAQIRYKATLPVGDRSVQHYQGHVHRDLK